MVFNFYKILGCVLCKRLNRFKGVGVCKIEVFKCQNLYIYVCAGLLRAAQRVGGRMKGPREWA